MRLEGLEPPCPFGRQDLNLRCLPIPPQPHIWCAQQDSNLHALSKGTGLSCQRVCHSTMCTKWNRVSDSNRAWRVQASPNLYYGFYPATWVIPGMVCGEGLEPSSLGFQASVSTCLTIHTYWYPRTGSNRRPSPCKGAALPLRYSGITPLGVRPEG